MACLYAPPREVSGDTDSTKWNTAKAKDYFTRVITDFPNSPSSQIAAKKLQQFTDVKN